MRHADCVHWLRYTHTPSREQVSQHPSPSVRNGHLWIRPRPGNRYWRVLQPGGLREHAAGIQRLRVDGVEFEYQADGTGEPVVLIHGGGLVDGLTPLASEPALAEHHRIISYHRVG